MDVPSRNTPSTVMTNPLFSSEPFGPTADETLTRMTRVYRESPDRRLPSTESVVVAFVSITYTALKVYVVELLQGTIKNVLANSSDSTTSERTLDDTVLACLSEGNTSQLDQKCERLRMQSKKVRETLIEEDETEVLNGASRTVRVTRRDVEEWSTPWLQQLATTCREAMTSSGCSLNRIHSVEVCGMTARLPFVQRTMAEVFRMVVSDLGRDADPPPPPVPSMPTASCWLPDPSRGLFKNATGNVFALSPAARRRSSVRFSSPFGSFSFTDPESMMKNVKKQRISQPDGKGGSHMVEVTNCGPSANFGGKKDEMPLGLSLLSKGFCTKKETEFEKKYRDPPIDGLRALQTQRRLSKQEALVAKDGGMSILEIGNYTCVQKLYKTNFSVIYTGFDKTTGREVILKRPLIKGDCPMWLREETKMLSKCQGKHVVEMLGEFIEDGMPYLVLEKMECDFHQILTRVSSLSEADRKAYIIMVLKSIKEIHDKNVVHGDIKPENMLYSKGVGIKLADFGNATMEGEHIRGRPTYTRTYRALNLFKRPSEKDKTSDMWALGMFHQDLVMETPHWARSRNDYEHMQKIENEISANFIEHIPEFNALDTNEHVFMRCLSRIHPKERMSVSECLGHPWIREGCEPTPIEKLPGLADLQKSSPKRKRDWGCL